MSVLYCVSAWKQCLVSPADTPGISLCIAQHFFCTVIQNQFATRCFEKGMIPRTVQEIMGHANYNTEVSCMHVLGDIKTQEALSVGDFLQNNKKKEIEYGALMGII